MRLLCENSKLYSCGHLPSLVYRRLGFMVWILNFERFPKLARPVGVPNIIVNGVLGSPVPLLSVAIIKVQLSLLTRGGLHHPGLCLHLPPRHLSLGHCLHCAFLLVVEEHQENYPEEWNGHDKLVDETAVAPGHHGEVDE